MVVPFAAILLAGAPIGGQTLDGLRRRADLGAQIAGSPGQRYGRVVRVDPGSPLFAAGLRPKDEVVAVNGRPLEGAVDLDSRLAALRGGDTLRLDVRRGGTTTTIAAALPALPLEQLRGLETQYIAVKNPRGPRQRGILTRPAGARGRLPAILFVPWLSCDSIESPKGASPGIDQLLERVAMESGFVMLRVDKPGVGDSEGVCAGTDLATEMDGNRAGLALLRVHPWVDTRRIVVMGHSFAGALLPEIAAGTPVAGYIVLNSWIRSWYERLIEFERLRLEGSGVAPADVTDRVRALGELYTMFLMQKRTPREVIAAHPHLAAVWEDEPEHQYGRSAAFHHQLAAFNPARGWSGVRVPTLAIWSEQDIVMHRQDHERLVALVNASTPGAARLVTAPGDHGMATAGRDGGRVLPEAVPAAIVRFLKELEARGTI
jgi:dienelactone hydrolase